MFCEQRRAKLRAEVNKGWGVFLGDNLVVWWSIGRSDRTTALVL